MTRDAGDEPLFLAVDVGMSGVKASVFDASGTCLHRQSVAVGRYSPRLGWSELDLDEVWLAVSRALRRVSGMTGIKSKVVGLGISVASPTVAVADSDGSPLCGAPTYSDNRAQERLEQLRGRIDDGEFLKITGNRLSLPTCSAVSMLHLADTLGRPIGELQFGHLSSYLVNRLTGRWVMDWTNASFTGLVDSEEPGAWSTEACESVGFPPELLPELVAPYQPVGGLTAQASAETGLYRSVTVVAGGADTACSAYGVGCIEEGDVFESAGTSGVLTFCQATPPENPLFMNRSHVVPGRWLSHGAMSAVGASIGWLADKVFPELADPEEGGFSRLTSEAAEAEVGAGGVTFLPYLLGERTPVWDPEARGAWMGLSAELERRHLIRAVFESAGYGLRQMLDIQEELGHPKVSEILLVGGGARNRFWTGLKADITGRRYQRAGEEETASLGAAMLAVVGADNYGDIRSILSMELKPKAEIIEPTTDESAIDTYERRYRVYTSMYRAQKEALAAGEWRPERRSRSPSP